MKLDEILEAWAVDSHLDELNVKEASLTTGKLHHKYWTMLTSERMIARKLETDYKALHLEKFEFLTGGHTEETRAKGYELPPCGRVMKAEMGRYLDADADLIKLSLKIGLSQEKIALLEDIIKSLNYRSNHIKNYIEFIKFQAGS